MGVTPIQRMAIADELGNTSGLQDGQVCQVYGIKMEVLEDIMESEGWERCGDCGWWCETGELADIHGQLISCIACGGMVLQGDHKI